jgi:hypothetical protein
MSVEHNLADQNQAHQQRQGFVELRPAPSDTMV